jgi:ABC-type uncharacterized transport system permease subunit
LHRNEAPAKARSYEENQLLTLRSLLMRPRDAKPYTWPIALAVGLGWGASAGVLLGFLRARHGFSFLVLGILLLFGLFVYTPVTHWATHRRWQGSTRRR